MKILAAILLLCVSTAQAGIITQTKSFGTQGVALDSKYGLGSVLEVLKVDEFDSTLGTLERMTVTIKSQIDAKGSITNKSDTAGYGSVALKLTNLWNLNGYDFITRDWFANLPWYYKHGYYERVLFSADSGGYSIDPDEVFEYEYSSGELVFHLDLGKGVTASDPTAGIFRFEADMCTVFINETSGGSSAFINQGDASMWGEITTQYHYTPVPEPTTWFMLAGVAFLLLRVASNRHV
ncbi:MAG: choice-of-anchor E domain-containing protein [Pseudoalteromonas sp.]|nr:choice-of-anchor E domain-containing protein [Pseudoalteromonas sp.]